MKGMFYDSKFNGNINDWNVSKLERVSAMFYKSEFSGDLSKWDMSKATNIHFIFEKYFDHHGVNVDMQFNRKIILPVNFITNKK